MQRDYWSALHQELNAQHGPISGNRAAQPQAWMNYSIGRTGFFLTSTMTRSRREIRAELYRDGPSAKMLFRDLRRQQGAIEGQLGYPLDWVELPDRRACRVLVLLHPADAEDKTDWPRQHRWLATKLNELHGAFAGRVRTLDADMITLETDPSASDEEPVATVDRDMVAAGPDRA